MHRPAIGSFVLSCLLASQSLAAAGPSPVGAQRELWKSEDRGRHWSRILEVKVGIDSVVAGPPGSREVYVGTIEYQTRVWRSADGGATWKELPQNGLPAGGVTHLAISPRPAGQPSKIYVGIGKSGLFESADEGATWRRRRRGLRRDGRARRPSRALHGS